MGFLQQLSGLHVGQDESDEGVERGSEAINDGEGGIGGGVGVGRRDGGDVRVGGSAGGIDRVDEAMWIKGEADGQPQAGG